MNKFRPKTVFEAIRIFDDEQNFEPLGIEPPPCRAVPGTADRIHEYRRRIAAGENLFCDGDENTFESLDETQMSQLRDREEKIAISKRREAVRRARKRERDGN